MTKWDLAEWVMDHLSRGRGEADMGIAYASSGLVKIAKAYRDLQQCRGNWSEMLEDLQAGVGEVNYALPLLRAHAGDRAAALIEFAEHELRFLPLLQDAIARMQATDRR